MFSSGIRIKVAKSPMNELVTLAGALYGEYVVSKDPERKKM